MRSRTALLAASLMTVVGVLGAGPATAGPQDPGPGATGGSAGSPVRVASASFIDSDTGWVLGTTGCPAASCTTVSRTEDAGLGWTALAAPAAPIAPSGEDGVDRIVAADADNAWAFYPQLHATHDGGASWARLTVPGGGTQVLALTTTADYVYVAVSTCRIGVPFNCAGPGSIWRAPVGADTFTRLRVPLPAQGFPSLRSSEQTVYVNGARPDGTPYLYGSTDGSTFLPRRVPCEDPTISALLVAPSTSTGALLLCSQNVGLGDSSKVAYATADAAVTTSRRGEAGTDGSPVGLAAQRSTGLIAVSGADSELLLSPDAGARWIRVYTGRSELLADPQLVGTLGAAVSGPAMFPLAAGDLLLSRDGGRHWQAVPVTG